MLRSDPVYGVLHRTDSPVAVVVEGVVGSHGNQSSIRHAKRVENLSTRLTPDLQEIQSTDNTEYTEYRNAWYLVQHMPCRESTKFGHTALTTSIRNTDNAQ